MGQDPQDAEPPDLNVGPVTPYQALPNLPPAPTHPTERRLLVQEIVRAGLVFTGFICLLIFTGFICLLIVLIGGLIRAQNWDQVREVMEITVPVIGAIVAGGGAYYLNDRRRG